MVIRKAFLRILAVTAAVIGWTITSKIDKRAQPLNNSVKYRTHFGNKTNPANNNNKNLTTRNKTLYTATTSLEPLTTEPAHTSVRRCEQPTESFTVTQHRSDIVSMISNRNSNAQLQKRTIPRKIVFGMTFDCEEWLLEIKLNELGGVVDYFIIVEGSFTFQNTARKQCFPGIMAANRQISRWQSKIIYVYDTESIPDFEYWEAEVHYRNMIGVKGLTQINTTDEDLVIITDVDELPHPNFLWALKWHDGFKTAITLSMLWSYYSFKWINPRPWTLKAILSVREVKLVQNQTNRIRFDLAGQPGWETSDTLVGWHCSWCMPTRAFLDKLAHFAHKELNQDHFKKIEWLNSMRDQGLWFPDSGPNGCVQSRLQIPEYVKNNLQRFKQIWI
jgi:hypothetical protein